MHMHSCTCRHVNRNYKNENNKGVNKKSLEEATIQRNIKPENQDGDVVDLQNQINLLIS